MFFTDFLPLGYAITPDFLYPIPGISKISCTFGKIFT